MKRFNKHIVQPGDTLESIAELYKISKNSLLYFHNQHCEMRDMMLYIITEQKEIFIPRTAVLDEQRKVKFGWGNRLVFQPINLSNHYSVMIHIEEDGQQNELKYDASVQWVTCENELHFFEIDILSKLYLNEEEVNGIADLLAYKTSQILYPMQISVDFQGKFNTIENISAIKERWELIKKEVYHEFEGMKADEYCQKIQAILDEPHSLVMLVKNNYFIRTLFLGIYSKFNKDFELETTETFPIVHNSVEPTYRIHLEIDPIKDEYNLINVVGNGTLHDERTQHDFSNEMPFPSSLTETPEINEDGTFTLRYYLNGETRLPESLYLECDIQLENRKKVTVMITAI